MNGNSTAEMLRSAPGWLIALIAILAVLMLVLAGPLAGYAIKRRREAEMAALLERPGLQRSHGKWIETGEMDLTSLRAEELKRDREDFRAQGGEFIESDPVQVIADLSPTSIITIVPESTQPIAKPAWAELPTAGWTAQEYAVEVHDAVLMEDEEPHSFYADPLGSWTIPEDEDSGWPTAKTVMEEMIDRKWLTGIGADIDVEWAAWNLYEKQESMA